jgi:glycosyltransferase involved in cell wall biosynthesis
LKILHTVEFYYPSIGGAQEVVRHLSERMVKKGHDVTVVTTKLPNRSSLMHNGVKIVEFDIRGNKVNGLSGEVESYKNFLLGNKFDVVMNYAAQQWTTDVMLEVLDKVNSKKVLVPCGYSALYDPAYKGYFENLPKYLNLYDATVYLSDDYRDIDFARQHKLKNITIIPNGADEAEFTTRLTHPQKVRIKNSHGIGGLTLMTIANYTGEKGHAELLGMFKRLPIPKATLISAGTNTPHEGWFDVFEAQTYRVNNSRKFLDKRIVMVDGTKRAKVRELLKSADIFVFFSNIECSPLVLFEAAAAGVPFIASDAGNNAEIARWTGGGIIVKSHDRPNGRVAVDLKDAVWQTARLGINQKRRRLMGATAHKNWKQKFTWEVLTDEYIKLYDKILNRESS